MTRLPRLTGRRVVRALQGAGFVIVRTRGSHRFLQHPDGRATVVPVHAGETIGPGLMSKILRECEMERDQLLKFL